MDQRTCIKFCIKNEIKCSKVCEMLTKAYGESVIRKQEFSSGISVSKMAVKTLKMTNAPDAPAHQKLMKTWKK